MGREGGPGRASANDKRPCAYLASPLRKRGVAAFHLVALLPELLRALGAFFPKDEGVAVSPVCILGK